MYLVMGYSDMQKTSGLILCCSLVHFHIQDYSVVDFLVEDQEVHWMISTSAGGLHTLHLLVLSWAKVLLLSQGDFRTHAEFLQDVLGVNCAWVRQQWNFRETVWMKALE